MSGCDPSNWSSGAHLATSSRTISATGATVRTSAGLADPIGMMGGSTLRRALHALPIQPHRLISRLIPIIQTPIPSTAATMASSDTKPVHDVQN
jgi:hypothetical protein